MELHGQGIKGRVVPAQTPWDEITELVTDSYHLTAPKKLIAELDADDRQAST